MKRGLFFLLTAMLSFTAVWAQRVSGKVTASGSGEPLVGVAVVAEGTAVGVLTDDEGAYMIDVPENATALVFSYYGYKTVTETPSGGTLDVQMEEDVMQTDVQVITALGVKREQKAIGYAAQSIDGSQVKNSGEVNVVQGLSQKVAGVQIYGSGGTPGASSKIIIRGNSSFTGNNQPLFIIDGVPMDNQTSSTQSADDPYNATLEGVNNSNRAIDINPDDIETITVLKGPSAAALYGVRAANGAVVITTKRGAPGSGKALNINYNTSYQVDQVNKLPERQTIYGQGTGGGRFNADGTIKEEGSFTTASPGDDGIWFTDDDVLGTAQSWGPKISSIDGNKGFVDNAANYFQKGTTWNNNVSVSGGNDRSTFRLSLGTTDQKGIVPNTGLKRTSVRLTGDTRLSDKVSVFGTANFINTGATMAQNGSNLSGVMLSLMRMPGSFDGLGSGSGDGYAYANGEQHNYFFAYDNPWWTAYKNPFTSDVNRLLGNVSANYKPTSWLDVTYRLGTDNYTDTRKQVYEIGSRATGDYNYQGELRENILTHNEIYSDLLVNAKHSFSEDLKGSLTLGNNLNERTDKDLFSRGRFLTIPGFHNLSNASSLYANESHATIRSAAMFFDANVSYKTWLFLQVTGRNEWASTFAKANFFPSANMSFVFTDLLPENKVLSFGKVRLAYAQGGNNPPVYTSRTYYSVPAIADGFTNGMSFPYLGQSGFGYSVLLGNKDLKPERTIGKEVGFDLRFFNGRLNLDLTLYDQRTKDIIVLRPIAPSTGFGNFASNSGSMQNKGIEAIVSGSPVKTEDFEWNIAVNFTRNVNKVLALAPGVTEYQPEAGFGDIASFAVVGQPYGMIYGTKWDRASQDSTKLAIDADGYPNTDGVNKPLASPYPNWLAGIRNTFTYKKISLTALVDVRNGGSIWGGTIARMNNVGTGIATANRTQSFIIPGLLADGTENNIPVSPQDYYRYYLGDFGGGARENAIFDGSWVRLRELGLNYNIKLNKDVPVFRTVAVGFVGRNLLLFTDYPGVDPETSLNGAGSNIGGWDYFNMPSTKSVQFNLSLGF